MAGIRPAPAIVVPADMPIGDAIRKMRDRDVGSLLIVREVVPHDLVGIFTERDLVHKVDEIQHGGYWDKGIASVMTHPVISLSVFELGRAPELMSRLHIRHLPVVYVDGNGQNHIVGVIGMRDLFKGYYETGVKTALERSRKSPPKITLACRNPLSIGMLRTILSQNGKADILEVDPDVLVENLAGYLTTNRPDLLVVDLDFVAAGQWAKFLQRLNRERKAPTCVVLFTPDLHEKRNTAVLQQLSDTGKIAAYAKPIDVLGLLQRLEKALET
jgi:CBS domain-containing protein